jgi:hypothetical protein
MRNLTRYPLVAALSLAGLFNSQLTAAPATVSTVDTAERSNHFNAVNRQLELGGVLYGYIDIDGDVAKLGGTVSRFAEQAAALNPMAALARQDYAILFEELGLTGVKAIGLSSVAEGKGFRNKVFFYTPAGRRGLLAMYGGSAKPFANTRLAPADTDVFWEGELDVPAAYAALRGVVVKIGGEGLAEALEREIKKPSPQGVTPHEVIQSLAGRYTLVVRLDVEKRIELPGGTSVPGVSFFIKADGVAPVMKKVIQEGRELSLVTEADRTFFETTQSVPMTAIKPVLLFEGDTFVVASSRAFAFECLSRSAGGLSDQADFKAALSSVGHEGNGLTYVTPRFFGEMRAALAVIAQMQPQAMSAIHLFQTQMPELDRPIVSVRSNLPEGILIRSYSFRSLKQEVLLGANSPVTIGVLAAMAIPAFQKVRMNSHQKMIQNNLRQFNAAAQQYMLETGKTSAGYTDLVGPEDGKYLRELKPVDGEDYESLVLKVSDTEISVTTAKGKTVTIPVD